MPKFAVGFTDENQVYMDIHFEGLRPINKEEHDIEDIAEANIYMTPEAAKELADSLYEAIEMIKGRMN